ncbi:MAG: hypothetical protein ABIA08_01715 [bacterium]
MISEKIIENTQNVLILIERGIITKDEVRKMLELKPKTSKKEVVGKKNRKK